jgi:hypothetical protein
MGPTLPGGGIPLVSFMNPACPAFVKLSVMYRPQFDASLAAGLHDGSLW